MTEQNKKELKEFFEPLKSFVNEVIPTTQTIFTESYLEPVIPEDLYY